MCPVLRCAGGAAATGRPARPVQAPAHSAPVPGGVQDPRAPGKEARAVPQRGGPPRWATQGARPRPETAPAYLLHLDPEAAQPGRGRAGDVVCADPAPQGRLQAPPYGCPGVSAPATRESLVGGPRGPLLPRLGRPAPSICYTGRVAAHTLRRLGTGSAPATHVSSRLPPDRGRSLLADLHGRDQDNCYKGGP
ncbi:hypothetical protein NDU88_005906 [Pleurodeles waltl]|uniref:Uncharacterized protein n=1 Tax=Pleurodeles waltl TaxID=8319 RepID=A0AAV7UJD6_PLEWA|nr:hypothetical protein NDU88_005906 [Pleurodeles waltl]